MVLERRELRLTLPCLEERLKKARKAFDAGAEFAARSTEKTSFLGLKDEHRQAFEEVEYLTASELETARERVKEMDERLALC